MTKSARILSLAAFTVAGLILLVHLKIAWAGDDAYIVFRSLEQLFAGNGPRWNPHDRVQVFTSPLWFWYLAAFRAVSSNVFLNSIVASLLPFAGLLLLLRRHLGDDRKWIVAMLLLVASNGFFDFTSSGLENPLAYLLLAVFALAYERSCTGTEAARAIGLPATLATAGLVLFCRLDLAPLILPPVVFAFAKTRHGIRRRRWIAAAALGLTPLLGWSIFSLVYYGTVLPNTAFAKLGAGIPAVDLWMQGLHYLWACLRFDTITILVILLALVAGLTARQSHVRFLAAGILLDLVYVVSIGGDFMLGRFLAFGYLFAVLLLVQQVVVFRSRWGWGDLHWVAPLVLYLMLYDHTPVNSRLQHQNGMGHFKGVADERGAYAAASLWRYWRDRPEVFPDHRWSTEGFDFAHSKKPLDIRSSVGFFGYWAGTDKKVVDLLGLGDPLLARLEVDPRAPWRIGHFTRGLPRGYLEKLVSNDVPFPDPGLEAYYERLRIVTQSEPLWTHERLRAILAMRCGFLRPPDTRP